jgi:predicted Zn-dependent protease
MATAMQTPFEVLGVKPDADETAIRSAYHKLAKSCHPDKFLDPEDQRAGQAKLIVINLAYEQAMKIAASRQTATAAMPLKQAKDWAVKLLERKQYELALLQLSKAETKDAHWYALQAQTLMGLKQYLSAHQAWRTAVRLDPEELAYRRGALEAEMHLKRANTLPGRVFSQLRDIFQR